MKDTNSRFRFYKQDNIKIAQQIQKAQFAEYISLYGIELDYFSRNLDYFSDNGEDINSNTYDYTVWSGPETSNFGLKIPIVAVIDYGSDSFMFSSFGADMTSEGTFYITKEQFQVDCMSFGGCESEEININESYKIECKDFKVDPYDIEILSNNKLYEIVIEDKNGIDFIDNVNIDNNYENFNAIVELKKPTNSDVVGHIYIERNDNYISKIETLSATILGVLDETGKGILDVNITGKAKLNKFNKLDNARNSTKTSKYLDIKNESIPITYKPKTGDFVRMYMVDDVTNFRDYEITQVVDADLSDDGISPYITAFLWKCSFVRRKASSESFDTPIQNEMTQEPKLETTKMKEADIEIQTITAEDKGYNYGKSDIEYEDAILQQIDTGLDKVYGGYGRSKRKGK